MKSLIQSLAHYFGLHPLVAFAVVVIDFVLFSGEVLSAGGLWVVSIPVAVFLSIGIVLIQRFGMKEEWGLAIGKGLILGVLTAIPTAIFGVIGGLSCGVAGVLGMLFKSKPEITQAPEAGVIEEVRRVKRVN